MLRLQQRLLPVAAATMTEPAAGTHCVSTTHWYRHHQQILEQLHQRQKVSSSCSIACDHCSFQENSSIKGYHRCSEGCCWLAAHYLQQRHQGLQNTLRAYFSARSTNAQAAARPRRLLTAVAVTFPTSTNLCQQQQNQGSPRLPQTLRQ